MARTRMTRQELKAQDEITNTLQRFTAFALRRRRQIIAAVSVVVVVAVIFIGWRIYSGNRNAAAQRQLAAAISVFNDTLSFPSDQERYERTISEAQATYDAYGSLPAGIIAQYYTALSQEGLGQTAQAIETLQQVIARGDATIRGVAQFALANIHKKHGDTEQAIEVYQQLQESGGYSQAAVLYELAELYAASDEPGQARDYYLKLVTEFPDSPLRPVTDEALRRLDTTTGAAVP